VALVLGGLAVHAVLRHYPGGRLVAHAAFFLLLTVLLFTHDIEPYSPAPANQILSFRLGIGFAKAVWWVTGALVLVSAVRFFIVLEKKPREGRFVQDLAVGVIYLSAFLSIIAYVFSVPVGTLIATSGVFAIVLGLALQSTLNDVFSGVALNLGRPYALGDWVVLDDGAQGGVVEMNWRAARRCWRQWWAAATLTA
jgi:small-conductance mechanosensitive channel